MFVKFRSLGHQFFFGAKVLAAASCGLLSRETNLCGASPFGFQRIVNTQETAPPAEPTGQYEFVGIPAMTANSVVFGAKQVGQVVGGSGLYTRVDNGNTNGTITNFAKANTNAGPNPPVGTIAFFFDDPIITYGYLAARGSIYDGTNYKALTSVYATPHLPNTNFGSVAWGPPSLTGNTPTFPVNKVGLNITQLLNTTVDNNDFVPGGGGAKFKTFTPFGGVTFQEYSDVNTDYAVFLGGWTDNANVNRTGVYRWQKSTDTIVAVADKNISIPGFPVDKFDDNVSFYTTYYDNVPTTGLTRSGRPSLAGSTVAFAYNEGFSSPARAGVYRFAGNALNKIADVTTLNPAIPNKTFRHFEGVSTVGSATAFVANTASSIILDTANSIGGGYGIYFEACGGLKEVIREGQLLDGRVITNLELGQRGLTTAKFRYNLAFRAEFTDGTEGIYVASTSSLCFNPVPIADINPNLFSGSSIIIPPNDDIGTPVGSHWQMLSRNTLLDLPATLGVDFEQELVGVNGEPGNNPALIDYTMNGGFVAPEELALTFDQDLYLEGIELGHFDAQDSLQLTIGGILREVRATDMIDGVLPLGDIELLAGQPLRITWDPGNSLGDGVSFNGLGYRVIPEPGMLLGVVMCVLACGVTWMRTRRATTKL
ncbi:MAG: hypothetical protein SFX18_04975 [Pirellulales bacterium]|nr:hypothetical protein [Pirellulales bacterium]